MKRPYLTQFDRLLYTADTLTGHMIMLRFRWLQVLVAIEKHTIAGKLFNRFLCTLS